MEAVTIAATLYVNINWRHPNVQIIEWGRHALPRTQEYRIVENASR
jgi:hypothetical protein